MIKYPTVLRSKVAIVSQGWTTYLTFLESACGRKKITCISLHLFQNISKMQKLRPFQGLIVSALILVTCTLRFLHAEKKWNLKQKKGMVKFGRKWNSNMNYKSTMAYCHTNEFQGLEDPLKSNSITKHGIWHYVLQINTVCSGFIAVTSRW